MVELIVKRNEEDTESLSPPSSFVAAAVFNIHPAGAPLLRHLHKSVLPGAADPGSVTAATCITSYTPAAIIITDLHYLSQHLLLSLQQCSLLFRPRAPLSLLVLIHILQSQLFLLSALLLVLCPAYVYFSFGSGKSPPMAYHDLKAFFKIKVGSTSKVFCGDFSHDIRIRLS